jgi:hypothetical protein
MAADPERTKALENATQSLRRMQSFDPKSLPRTDELGSAINFSDAIEPATRLIDLYNQLPAEVLEQLPVAVLNKIKQQADSDFNLFQQILDFEAGTPKSERDSRIQQVHNAYDPAFQVLHPYISYSVRKSTDFSRLEREARGLIQDITDRASALQTDLSERKSDADKVLEAVRKVAEEQGVSQQAIYFKNEADKHAGEATTWLRATVALTAVVALYAICTLFLHKLPGLVPTNAYDAAQLAVSKILIFLTLSFFLLLASRNFVAHRHNAVVNRHRQNALATYGALVKAAGQEANRDVVLAKAADCIFSAQPTGFGKEHSADAGSLSLINLAPTATKMAGSG